MYFLNSPIKILYTSGKKEDNFLLKIIEFFVNLFNENLIKY